MAADILRCSSCCLQLHHRCPHICSIRLCLQILLRKGGIKEPTFTPAARQFVLFPTAFHTDAQVGAQPQVFTGSCAAAGVSVSSKKTLLHDEVEGVHYQAAWLISLHTRRCPTGPHRLPPAHLPSDAAAAQAGGSAAVRSRGAVRSEAAGAAVAGHLLHNHRCEGAARTRGWTAEPA